MFSDAVLGMLWVSTIIAQVANRKPFQAFVFTGFMPSALKAVPGSGGDWNAPALYQHIKRYLNHLNMSEQMSSPALSVIGRFRWRH
ncbi:MAG: hypothetical protein PVG35_07905 [Desulfobacterales bacterium]|jgi:hypothetical protein